MVPFLRIETLEHDVPHNRVILASYAQASENAVSSHQEVIRRLAVGVPIAVHQDLAKVMVERVVVEPSFHRPFVG